MPRNYLHKCMIAPHSILSVTHTLSLSHPHPHTRIYGPLLSSRPLDLTSSPPDAVCRTLRIICLPPQLRYAQKKDTRQKPVSCRAPTTTWIQTGLVPGEGRRGLFHRLSALLCHASEVRKRGKVLDLFSVPSSLLTEGRCETVMMASRSNKVLLWTVLWPWDWDSRTGCTSPDQAYCKRIGVGVGGETLTHIVRLAAPKSPYLAVLTRVSGKKAR
ncbi:uncharacterized protein EI97DRAFT_33530 [Westerdykella ornata]|uniref:Uncharacterized protein n=1 Tax=Westerdykella ornata TaxID=318751 RepID=A0A6A6JZR1_WESOR|nr:uncharacterized protein EI97DRAFT_33530 [Westerdykella ornata]KAF2281573.1 hypothetical protein EI97DRAFT_33530 [Westerdykella ornata]